jgi:hypothetical protein
MTDVESAVRRADMGDERDARDGDRPQVVTPEATPPARHGVGTDEPRLTGNMHSGTIAARTAESPGSAPKQ